MEDIADAFMEQQELEAAVDALLEREEEGRERPEPPQPRVLSGDKLVDQPRTEPPSSDQ
jgi:hypothetical protein